MSRERSEREAEMREGEISDVGSLQIRAREQTAGVLGEIWWFPGILATKITMGNYRFSLAYIT
jgi:hypothetical protein